MPPKEFTDQDVQNKETLDHLQNIADRYNAKNLHIKIRKGKGDLGPPSQTAQKVCGIKNGVLEIQFPYNVQDIALVKTISNRRWNSEKKIWTADLTITEVEKLMSWGFTPSSELMQWYKNMQAPFSTKQLTQSDIKGVTRALFPYQVQGVAFIESRAGRALLADEMGLGKTAQAIAWLSMKHKEAMPVIVVCPASLKIHWQRELKNWANIDALIVSGTYKRNNKLPKKHAYIINYDILADIVVCSFCKGVGCGVCKSSGKVLHIRPDIAEINSQTVILDEAHNIKSSTAQRTLATRLLAKRTPHILVLTGTPIVNRPVEMFNAINLISPTLFPSYWKFAQRYCGPKHNGFGWDFNGSSNSEELHMLLTKSVMIRRQKKDVLTELPEKMRIIVPMEIDNRTEYERATENFMKWLRDIDPERADKARNAEMLVKMENLKQLAVQGKMKLVLDWISDFLENGQKLVVFCTHTKVLNNIVDTFKSNAVSIDGSVSMTARQKAVDDFQSKADITLFVGNIKAAGVGLTLTAASSTAFVELGWTPGDHDQAEDRVHRIGQTAESVSAYYLIAESTIEEDIVSLIDSKRKVLDMVLDGKDTESASLFTELLKTWRKQK